MVEGASWLHQQDFRRDIAPKDWPRLFGNRTWGEWSPPTKRTDSSNLYCIEALLWWLESEHGVRAHILSQPDKNDRNSPQPDYECSTDNGKFWVEISALHNPGDRMKRLGGYGKFVKHLATELGGLGGRWTLHLPSHREVPTKGLKELAKRLASALIEESKASDSVTVSDPIKARLERRATGIAGVIVAYSTSDSFRKIETAETLERQSSAMLAEARLKFQTYDAKRCYFLAVTGGNTLGHEQLPGAFRAVDPSQYASFGGVLWLHLGLPHRLQVLHPSSDQLAL